MALAMRPTAAVPCGARVLAARHHDRDTQRQQRVNGGSGGRRRGLCPPRHAAMTGARPKPPPWSPWRRRADPRHDLASLPYARGAIEAIKAIHTVAWFSIESCMAFVVYAGFIGRTDRRVGLAAAVVAGECLVFVGYGFRCPLTELAERFGADRGGVTDIYLPDWFAHNMPAIHVPLIGMAIALHARNVRAHRA